MRMKNRFCGMGKSLVWSFLLLSTSGIAFTSCSDDYDLDEKTPDFLGGSIYDELKSGKHGSFSYTIRLINDLNYTDVMSKTGSKTLFVAPDEAYEAFFKSNPWGATSYDKLTLAQKRLLLNGSQLNNAYVVEMLSNCDNGEKNLCLRQNSSTAATDSVTFWQAASLPENFNEDYKEKKYWEWYRQTGKNIFMATDATVPMMTHFLEGQMNEKNIRRSDVAFILGKPWDDATNRSYIYDAQITKQDVVCLNGYIHVLDKVPVPPANMAEVIRTNGKTNIFSHILERFSAPFYNSTLTENFKALYDVAVDSVFEKRYFATHTQSGQMKEDPQRVGIADMPLLTFDPGWNALSASTTEEKEKDMSAMFVPNDEALADYFLNKGGRVLIERYAKLENTRENLLRNIDQIPLDVIQALVNNLMKSSFNETVPSKYLTIMNDARDQMFTAQDYPSLEAYKAAFDQPLLANNGVVYVMNRVVTPADYASVIAPALYNQSAQVMRTVVRADDSFIQGSSYNSAPLKQYFSTYLKAMQSRFSFFIPSDEGLSTYGYVDPVQLAIGTKSNFLTYKFVPASIGNATDNLPRIAIWSQAYLYDAETGMPSGNIRNNKTSRSNDPLYSGTGRVKRNLLIEMVNQHIVVHENSDQQGIMSGQKYFLSRAGAPVVVQNEVKGKGMKLNGGFQEQLKGTAAEHSATITEVYDHTKETNGYGNGMTYILDRPMQPTTITPYKALSNNAENSEFVKLCEGVDDQLLQDAGFRDAIAASSDDEKTKASNWEKETAKYYVFLRGNKGGSSYNTPRGDKLVRFFNNYRYTIYAPSNAAVLKAVNDGLPTWDKIRAYLDANLKAPITLREDKSNQAEVDAVNKHNAEVKLKAQAMVVALVNFLKYHFQDESLFVDNVSKDATSYMTSCVDEVNKVYLPLTVVQKPGTLSVTDVTGRTVSVHPTVHNILVRDANNDRLEGATYITSSSYAVVHQIDEVLMFDKSLLGKFNDLLASPQKVKAFLAKYRIKE